MELRLTTLTKEHKADRSLVTNADHEADRIIREGLLKAFPDHAVITEESGLQGNAHTQYVWIVDPLDGTKAYVNGTPGFSVMIGLMKEGRPYLGIVADPWEGHLYEAVRGLGAFHTLNGRRTRVRVSDRKRFLEMPLITSTGFPEEQAKKIRAALPCPCRPSINSVGIKVGLLVRQQADIYLNHHAVHYWDTCAPQVILEEAGGIFTYLDGQPLLYHMEKTFHHARPTLATNGPQHSELVRELSPYFQK